MYAEIWNFQTKNLILNRIYHGIRLWTVSLLSGSLVKGQVEVSNPTVTNYLRASYMAQSKGNFIPKPLWHNCYNALCKIILKLLDFCYLNKKVKDLMFWVNEDELIFFKVLSHVFCWNYLSQWWVEFKFELTWDCLQLSFLVKCY